MIVITSTPSVDRPAILAGDPAVLGAEALSLTALLAYVISRSIGLPSLTDDIGDWLNPLGVAATLSETATALICWHSLSQRSRSSNRRARTIATTERRLATPSLLLPAIADASRVRPESCAPDEQRPPCADTSGSFLRERASSRRSLPQCSGRSQLRPPPARPLQT